MQKVNGPSREAGGNRLFDLLIAGARKAHLEQAFQFEETIRNRFACWQIFAKTKLNGWPSPLWMSCLAKLRICISPEELRQPFHTMPCWADDVRLAPSWFGPTQEVEEVTPEPGSFPREIPWRRCRCLRGPRLGSAWEALFLVAYPRSLTPIENVAASSRELAPPGSARGSALDLSERVKYDCRRHPAPSQAFFSAVLVHEQVEP